MLNIFKKNTKFDRNIGSNLPLYYDNINVEGKTTQETRSGKNLLNINGTRTAYNSIITLNETGFNAISNGRTSRLIFPINVVANQTYRISFDFASSGESITSLFNIRIRESTSSSSWVSNSIGNFQVGHNSATITPTVTGIYYLWFYFNSSSTEVNYNVTLTNIQFEVGTEETPYEPYGLMPSPEYPSELVNVGYENLFSGFRTLGEHATYENGTLYSPQRETSKSNYIKAEQLQYIFSYNSTYASARWYVEEFDENYNQIRSNSKFSPQVFTLGSDTVYFDIAFSFASDTTFPLTISNMQLEKGSTAHSYVPYGKYGIEVLTQGKNIFTGLIKGIGLNSTNGAEATNANAATSDFIKVDFNTNPNYYLSGLTNTIRSYVAAYNSNRQFLGRTGGTRALSLLLSSDIFTVGTPQGTGDIAYLRVTQYYVSGDSGTIDDIDNLTIQLEKGSQATNYEPYTSHTNLITLDEPLRGIGDVKDLLYIKNGMLYVERNIKSVILNGSESWTLSQTSNVFYMAFAETNFIINNNIPKSNYFIGTGNVGSASAMGNKQMNTIALSSANTANVRIYIKTNVVSTKDSLIQWLSTHNTEVQYILAEPIVETYELDVQPMIYESLGYGTLSDVISDPLITEELNGSYILEFEYLKDGKFSEYLVEENIVKANGQPFSIYSVKKDTESKIKILAKHWVLNEWTKDFVLDSEPTNLPAQGALEWIQNRSINHSDITINGDCTDAETARYVRKNMLDAIFNEDNAILKRFGGELSYNVNNVTVNNHRGNLSGLTIRQGKNLKGAEYYLDFSTVVTRLVPVGKDGLMLDDVYVDSPLINNYATPIIKKVEVDSDDPAELENYCNKLFEDGIDKPSISIKIDFIELSKTIEYQSYSSLETAHLGDTVNVYIPSLKLNVSTRVVKTVYNDNLQRITSLELGNTMPNIATSNVNTQKQLEKQAENDISVLAEAKQAATEMINHPFSGHLFIDETTGNLYIMDTTDINTAQNIWRWGLGGLGFSSNGINGPYAVAMTQDGKIVADFITTGILQSIEIRATTGTVGGFTLNPDKFTANISKEYNFTLTDVQKAVDYANGIGTLTDEELDEYDVNGDGVVDKLDANTMLRMYYEYISNIINGTLEFNSTDSRRVITLKDGDGNISTSLGLNGIKTKALNCETLSLGGNNVEPQSILSNWYSTSSETLKNAQKHKLLIVLAKPASSSAITSVSIPTDILTTSNQQFQCADEAAYVSFNLKYSDDDIIITGAGRSSNGTIVKVYTVM